MLNARMQAAQQVADRLIALEKIVDLAVIQAAELAGCMPAARVAANLAAEVGHGALQQATAALSTLVIARGQIVAAHQELAIAQGEAGLAAYALGGLANKRPGTGMAAPGLAAVS